jgi:hypothetical protein
MTQFWFCYSICPDFWLPEYKRPDEVLVAMYKAESEQTAKRIYGDDCKLLTLEEAVEFFRLDRDEVEAILENIPYLD